MKISERVHFIGIGGAGMSGLATILVELGHKVSGSDINETKVTERLQSKGVTFSRGHYSRNVEGAELIVVSTAIKKDNPELLRALEEGKTIIHRGQLLALLMSRQKGIAIAGAHGKTTTTSMMASVMEKNGLDPTIVIGGELADIGGNAKLGKGQYLVAEADESDGSFLRLVPEIVVVTNVENDHLDYYGTVEKINEAFISFLSKVTDRGLAVVCIDDPGNKGVLKQYTGPLITYGIDSPNADYLLKNISFEGMSTRGEVYFKGQFLGSLVLTVPGLHNILNALAVVAVGMHIGMDFNSISKSLTTFKGAGRRFQLTGEISGVMVVDDYAHHPTEVKAALSAASQVGASRVIALFQPHRYSRTSLLQEEFGKAFENSDIVIVDDIYAAGEEPIEGITSDIIIDAIRKNGHKNVYYLGTGEKILDYLEGFVKSGDLVMTIGAGNIWSTGVSLVERLAQSSGGNKDA
ncbi:MAG: UDP-N-acetylmuramate--L-alanine ligase [Peptococcaceae bacterium]|nr:UDP-N-acetylmuramate--L-alanine ligase [Peptococcaceae bacterium]